MRGAIGSLNAAVAGSILLFAAVAQRDPGGEGSADRPRPATFDEIADATSAAAAHEASDRRVRRPRTRRPTPEAAPRRPRRRSAAGRRPRRRLPRSGRRPAKAERRQRPSRAAPRPPKPEPAVPTAGAPCEARADDGDRHGRREARRRARRPGRSGRHRRRPEPVSRPRPTSASATHQGGSVRPRRPSAGAEAAGGGQAGARTAVAEPRPSAAKARRRRPCDEPGSRRPTTCCRAARRPTDRDVRSAAWRPRRAAASARLTGSSRGPYHSPAPKGPSAV